MKNGAVKIAVSCCCLLLLFAACNKRALYHDLSEGEANEILVVLQQNDISAGKIKEVRQNEVFWSIEVSEPNLSKAQAILLANNLPRKRELGLTGVYKEKGLIPTPDEQKARFLLALKGEIINSLEKLPEVVDADVVLNVPTKEEFAKKGETERPTASVVIKAKAPESGPSQINEMKIQEFVANSVEGMAPRDVSVLLSFATPTGQAVRPGFTATLSSLGSPGVVSLEEKKRAPKEESHLMGLSVTPESKKKLKIYLVVFFLILVVLASALIVTIVQASRFRSEINNLKRDSAGAIEAPGGTEGQRRLGPGGA